MPERFYIPKTHEHLESGMAPIRVSLGNSKNHETSDFHKGDFEDALNIDYFHPTNSQKGFAMSPVDSKNKFSKEFSLCTALLVTGVDKETGKNISFLSHQAPQAISIDSSRDVYLKSLREALNEIKMRCKVGTIDAVMAGGTVVNSASHSFTIWYRESVREISNEVQSVLNFKPIVTNGPKEMYHDVDEVYYDTPTEGYIL